MIPDTTFMQFAKCKGVKTPDFFFSDQTKGTNEAIAFCQDCPVKVPCGQFAMDNNIDHGIWGGLSVRSRRKIKSLKKRLESTKN